MLSHDRSILPLTMGALLLVGAGCFDFDKPQATVSTNAAATGEAAMEKKEPRQIEVDMGAVGSAGLAGKAVLIEENDKTRVMLNLSGDATAVAHPAHIHAGDCAAPGEVTFALADVVSGKSVTLVDARFDDIMASGRTAVRVHRSGAELGVYVSCGELLASKVMDKQPGIEAMMEADLNVNVNADLNVNGGAMMAPKVVTITAKQFSFTPAEVTVKLGDKVRLEITSLDVDHGFALPTFNVSAVLKANATTVVEFTADKRGNYPFFCTVFCGSGHADMRGALIVE